MVLYRTNQLSALVLWMYLWVTAWFTSDSLCTKGGKGLNTLGDLEHFCVISLVWLGFAGIHQAFSSDMLSEMFAIKVFAHPSLCWVSKHLIKQELFVLQFVKVKFRKVKNLPNIPRLLKDRAEMSIQIQGIWNYTCRILSTMSYFRKI